MQTKYIQIALLATVFGLQFFFEHVFPQKKELNNGKNERFNTGIGIINILFTFFPAWLMVQWVNLIETKHWGLLNAAGISYPLKIILALPVLDCWMYSWHRLNHHIPFFWRFHRFHHSDEKMNSTTAFRFHFAELLLSYPCKALVCLLAGINYMPLLIYECLFFTSVIIHHSNIRINSKIDTIYRVLFVSPMMHRIHHSMVAEEQNTNYGALFSFWDRLFKSWKKPAAGEIRFGIKE